MFRSVAIVLALVATSLHPLFAQEKLLPVFHFKPLEGYGGEYVTARVVRNSPGFVWIRTLSGGLLRYDGYGFKAYRSDPNDPYSISYNRIHSLLLDSRGRLWVGTREKRLCLYDPPPGSVYPRLPGARRHFAA